MTRTAQPRADTMSLACASDEFIPARVMDVEITEPLPAVSYDEQYPGVWVLGRLHNETVGTGLIHVGRPGLTPDRLGALLWPKLREAVAARFAAAGLSEPCGLGAEGLAADAATWPFLRRRAEVLATAPFISVVICTRGRPDLLKTCLRRAERIDYPHFEIVVVDNAPTNDAARRVVQARQGGTACRCRYAVEPRAGLSWARNAGLAAARGDIVAFTDDDGEPDSQWLAALAGGFAKASDIGCVTGMILPTHLDTPAQALFEDLGGHSKGRGFSAVVFSRHGPQNPLFPLPAFGAGANMAFRREALARIGGFDVALGAGTPALAGEDTLALTLTLLAGYRIAYEPAALVRHNHRRTMDGLGRQLHGYSTGLTAYYAALLRHRPSVVPRLLGLIPAAAGYLRNAGHGSAAAQPDLLSGLMWRRRQGMLIGPVAYLQGMRRQARFAGPPANSPEAGQ
jgi:glycosyltransferase involved in cell wall biosynthesis